jgi:hypothetical protein
LSSDLQEGGSCIGFLAGKMQLGLDRILRTIKRCKHGAAIPSGAGKGWR